MPWKPAKVSSTARGYGKTHRQARTVAASRHQSSDPCVRCGHALGPMGPWLHLDHNDTRTGYLGFSHGAARCPVCGDRCNLAAGAKKANRIQKYGKPRAVIDRW